MPFLLDDDGVVLSLMDMKVARETEIKYLAVFHIDFMQESEAQVNRINDGLDVPPPGKQHELWTFYMGAPGGFTVEVLC